MKVLNPVPFNFFGPYNSLGYGIASMGYAIGLKRATNSVFPFAAIGPVDEKDADLKQDEYSDLLENFQVPVNPELPSIGFWHFAQIDLVRSKKLRVGISTFEVDNFTKEERERILKLDLIGTCSQWGANILKERFPEREKDIFYVPHAMKFSDRDTPPVIDLDKLFPVETWSKVAGVCFPKESLVITSGGKFEKRKGHLVLLESAARLSSPTVIIGFWGNIFIPNQMPYYYFYENGYTPVFTQNLIKVFRKNNSWVVLMPRATNRAELHGSLARGHFFASPSFAEGWDLPLFEMMSYGMPCIATTHTAHSEYCNSENVLEVKHESSSVPALDNRFFNGLNGNWQEVHSMDEALMLAYNIAIENKDIKYLRTLQQNAIRTTSEFSWERSARKLLTTIESRSVSSS